MKILLLTVKNKKRKEAELRQQLAPLRKQATQLENQMEKLGTQLQQIETDLADPSLYDVEMKAKLTALFSRAGAGEKAVGRGRS